MLYFNSISKPNKPNGYFISQVFVFKEEACIGWDCFHKDRISVGSTHKADIRLDDTEVEGIHATIYFEKDQVLVVSQSPKNIILVNGKAVGSCKLHSLDFISIGSHTLKIKVVKISATPHPIDKINDADKAEDTDTNSPKVPNIKEGENFWRNWVEEDEQEGDTEDSGKRSIKKKGANKISNHVNTF